MAKNNERILAQVNETDLYSDVTSCYGQEFANAPTVRVMFNFAKTTENVQLHIVTTVSIHTARHNAAATLCASPGTGKHGNDSRVTIKQRLFPHATKIVLRSRTNKNNGIYTLMYSVVYTSNLVRTVPRPIRIVVVEFFVIMITYFETGLCLYVIFF